MTVRVVVGCRALSRIVTHCHALLSCIVVRALSRIPHIVACTARQCALSRIVAHCRALSCIVARHIVAHAVHCCTLLCVVAHCHACYVLLCVVVHCRACYVLSCVVARWCGIVVSVQENFRKLCSQTKMVWKCGLQYLGDGVVLYALYVTLYKGLMRLFVKYYC